MTTQQRHQNIADARTILVIARATQPMGTPVDKFLGDAIKKLQDQMAILETLLLADDSFECGCGEVVENGADHQCGYIEACAQEDEQSRNYAQRVM